MKTVYFVRHGESESNARTTTRYKGKDSELTEKGRRQAEIIAERALRIPFDVLISSPWVRARDTAEAISRTTGKPVEYSDLFTETRVPLSLSGMRLDDAAFIEKHNAWNQSLFVSGVRIEEGENFDALRERAKDALAHLESRQESRLLIATHGMFLRCLMAHVLLGDALTPELLRRFTAGTKTENTSVSVFTYGTMPHHDVDPSKRWRLRVFNDHAHLG